MPSTVQNAEATIFRELRSRYPRTVAAFSRMENGERALKDVADLEKRWVGLNAGGWQDDVIRLVPTASDLPRCPPEKCYDIIIAGASLGLVAGAALAQRGWKVLVFDRGKAGAAHREWNISRRELQALSRWNIFTPDEWQSTVATRYRTGVISFDAKGTGVEACPLYVEGVLDTALDAQSVLNLARTKFEQAGGTILEQRSFVRLHTASRGEVASVFELETQAGTEYYACRLAVDTMGSVSPIAMSLNGGLPFDGVCPTAGTIVMGLDLDPAVGEVLVSVAPTQGGRQLIWEGFPGRHNETTVYLFYYDKTGARLASEQSLLALFEQYFALLPTYRATTPEQRHVKPVYGYIPARHGRTGRTASRGLICLGDSAAGQSPLTFCGFGSFVRHIGRVAALTSFCLEHNLLDERHLKEVSPHQANLRVAWVFGRLMQPWSKSDPAGVNRLMNIFCKALAEVGPQTTVRFLQDRYSFGDYMRIMLTTARRYPAVFGLTARVLGPFGLARWAGDIMAFGMGAIATQVVASAGTRRWKRLERLTQRVAPAVALKMRAARTYRQAVS